MQKVLFVTSSIGTGGNEKVLLNVLRCLNSQKFDIFLLVLDGDYSANQIPEYIHRYELEGNYNLLSKGIKKGFPEAIKRGRVDLALCLIREKILNYKKNTIGNYRIFWSVNKEKIEKQRDCFDKAIAFGLGIQVPIVADKINTRSRIAWVNNDCSKCLDMEHIHFLNEHYAKFDDIVTVTETAEKGFQKVFANLHLKTRIIKDLFDEQEIIDKSRLVNNPFDFVDRKDSTIILTVGRVSQEKGYFLLIETAAQLKKKNFSFYWVIIGNGDVAEYLEYAKRYCVDDVVLFIGERRNPYPFIRECNIYVQTSLWEGNCLTLIEAMVLEKPIVSTNFPSAIEKIEDGKNGLLSDMDAESLSEKISFLIQNKTVQDAMCKHLKENRLNTQDEIGAIEMLLEE